VGEPAASAVTEDRLLGGRVRLVQPAAGYRVAIDPVILAAAVPVEPGELVLDAGCGSGAAALCLAARVADCRIVGVERQAASVALAKTNLAANDAVGRIEIAAEDLADHAARNAGVYDQVMTNPPFHEAGRHTPAPDEAKAAAHGESALSLADWITCCGRTLRPGGRLTLIHRADRLGDLLAGLAPAFGAIHILPLWPRAGMPAKRLVMSAIKGRKTLPALLPGIVLHAPDGRFTAAAEAILRHGAALGWTPPIS
jgi:tRNA1(Val) A37 N6-methylase TrmN6